MRQKKTKLMLDYWMNLFHEAGNTGSTDKKVIWPERSDVQPASCRDLLSDMFILEHDGGSINYRLAGTNLCKMYGRELKRETFVEAFVGADQRSVETWVHRLGLDDYVVLICSQAETERSETVNVETLLLPLNHHGKRGQRFLGITSACDTPHWLGVRPIISQSIKTVRVLHPWESDTFGMRNRKQHTESTLSSPTRPKFKAPHLFQDPFLGEALDQISTAEKTIKRVAHLTVIDGGRD